MWTESLLAWYSHNARQMPWRSDPRPYYVWISEMMLQQTQVVTVIPYFQRFIAAFPTITDLANAPLDAVLKIWEGLGYYSRARHLHQCAQCLIADYNGQLPHQYDVLQQLPGIGPYIAAAITSIAFHNPVPVVDGNVLRVFSRFWGLTTDIRLPAARIDIFNRLTPYISTCAPSEFNQAIMELGAMICRPKGPLCGNCPISSECVAFHTHQTDCLPIKSKSAPIPHFTIGVGLIYDTQNRILITKRKPTQMLGGLWEFPGGKQHPGESTMQTVCRELNEELGIDVIVQPTPIGPIHHAYTHFKISMTAHRCTIASGIPQARHSDAIAWATLSEMADYPFPGASRKLMRLLTE